MVIFRPWVTCEIPDKKYIYFISAFPSGLKCNESCISIGFARRFGGQYTLFFIRILFFWPGLNFLIFLPILGWKYSCIILLKKKEKNYHDALYGIVHFFLAVLIRYKCTTCIVHRTVISIKHLAIASLSPLPRCDGGQ